MNPLELLFPKARVEVFKHLLLPPTPQLHLRELARLSSLAVGTIQREVKVLLSGGVIQEEEMEIVCILKQIRPIRSFKSCKA